MLAILKVIHAAVLHAATIAGNDEDEMKCMISGLL